MVDASFVSIALGCPSRDSRDLLVDSTLLFSLESGEELIRLVDVWRRVVTEVIADLASSSDGEVFNFGLGRGPDLGLSSPSSLHEPQNQDSWRSGRGKML